jgi:hypothetical protein
MQKKDSTGETPVPPIHLQPDIQLRRLLAENGK